MLQPFTSLVMPRCWLISAVAAVRTDLQRRLVCGKPKTWPPAWEYARGHWPDQPGVLFGYSMGSAAILRAVAVHWIEPRGLILECPFDSLLHTVGHRCTAMHLPSFPLAHLLVLWGGVQHGFNGFSHNPANYARRVSCPVLLLHGDNDQRVNRSEAESIFANLQGEKQLIELAGVGHDGYVTASPEAWKHVVGDFLSRCQEQKPDSPRKK
jgi:pimeloyl-ACP methyl ester carboxylesterase